MDFVAEVSEADAEFAALVSEVLALVADVEAADAEFAALVAAVCAAFLYTSAFDSDTAAAEREAEALAAAEIASLE